jgi:hypothetical protein
MLNSNIPVASTVVSTSMETRAAKVGIDLSFLKLFQDETLLDIHAVPLL